MTEPIQILPRIRGIKEAIGELKEYDPETALTERGLRRLVITGEIPSVQIGTKYLINMDVLTNYLYDGTGGEELTAPNGGNGDIRIIKE